MPPRNRSRYMRNRRAAQARSRPDVFDWPSTPVADPDPEPASPNYKGGGADVMPATSTGITFSSPDPEPDHFEEIAFTPTVDPVTVDLTTPEPAPEPAIPSWEAPTIVEPVAEVEPTGRDVEAEQVAASDVGRDLHKQGDGAYSDAGTGIVSTDDFEKVYSDHVTGDNVEPLTAIVPEPEPEPDPEPEVVIADVTASNARGNVQTDKVKSYGPEPEEVSPWSYEPPEGMPEDMIPGWMAWKVWHENTKDAEPEVTTVDLTDDAPDPVTEIVPVDSGQPSVEEPFMPSPHAEEAAEEQSQPVAGPVDDTPAPVTVAEEPQPEPENVLGITPGDQHPQTLEAVSDGEPLAIDEQVAEEVEIIPSWEAPEVEPAPEPEPEPDPVVEEEPVVPGWEAPDVVADSDEGMGIVPEVAGPIPGDHHPEESVDISLIDQIEAEAEAEWETLAEPEVEAEPEPPEIDLDVIPGWEAPDTNPYNEPTVVDGVTLLDDVVLDTSEAEDAAVDLTLTEDAAPVVDTTEGDTTYEIDEAEVEDEWEVLSDYDEPAVNEDGAIQLDDIVLEAGDTDSDLAFVDLTAEDETGPYAGDHHPDLVDTLETLNNDDLVTVDLTHDGEDESAWDGPVGGDEDATDFITWDDEDESAWDGPVGGSEDEGEDYADTDIQTEIDTIDRQIEEETDPEVLKSLYQRRLRLFRMLQTQTRFAGSLLDDPDTHRANLLSIM